NPEDCNFTLNPKFLVKNTSEEARFAGLFYFYIMCTVTFARSGNSTIITSNRDEQTGRAPAMPPREYEIDGRKIWFPKDGQSGGTWFALDESGNVTVLLNGAKEPHEFRNDWRKSRGLILLEIFASDPISTWKSIDLDMIEPFTMVLF